MPITATIAIEAETPEELATAILLIQSPDIEDAGQFQEISQKLAEILELLNRQVVDQALIDQIFEAVSKGKTKLDAAIAGGTPAQ